MNYTYRTKCNKTYFRFKFKKPRYVVTSPEKNENETSLDESH